MKVTKINYVSFGGINGDDVDITNSFRNGYIVHKDGTIERLVSEKYLKEIEEKIDEIQDKLVNKGD